MQGTCFWPALHILLLDIACVLCWVGFCIVDFNKATHTAEVSKTPLKHRRAQEWRERLASGGNGQRGDNMRVVNLVEPCLYMGYVSSSAALLVEQPWAEVLKNFPPPVYKHRYGT